MSEKREFTFNRFIPLIYILSVLIIILLAFKLAIFLIPFVIAMLVVSITRPLVKVLVNKFKFSLKLANGLVISLFYIILFSIIGIIVFISLSEIYSFSNWVINNSGNISVFVKNRINEFDGLKLIIPDFATIAIKNSINYIISKLTGISVNFFNYIVTVSLSLPVALVYVIITVTASFLMANDLNTVKEFFNKQFPKSWISKFELIKVDAFSVAFKYFKAQIILIFLCFIELLLGFNIINIFIHPIPYVLILALIIAIIDALPILGTGSVLIPWSIYLLVNNEYSFGISLLILYVIIWLLRSIMEQRILSSSLNINPLISLVSLFVGFKLFGVIGFLFGPILFTIMTIVFDEEIKRGFFKILSGEEQYGEN
jgi:sporulation integral membrane protein YtvI